LVVVFFLHDVYFKFTMLHVLNQLAFVLVLVYDNNLAVEDLKFQCDVTDCLSHYEVHPRKNRMKEDLNASLQSFEKKGAGLNLTK